MSPSRAPPGDAVSRGRDVVEAIQMSNERKNARDKNELIQLLGLPHIQVSLCHFTNFLRDRIMRVYAISIKKLLPKNIVLM
jgi:hypothetical protein